MSNFIIKEGTKVIHIDENGEDNLGIIKEDFIIDDWHSYGIADLKEFHGKSKLYIKLDYFNYSILILLSKIKEIN